MQKAGIASLTDLWTNTSQKNISSYSLYQQTVLTNVGVQSH